MEIVQSIDRPDVNGVAPKMQAIADRCKEKITASYCTIYTSDNIMSSVSIRLSLDPKESWSNGIWQNSRHLRFALTPEKGQRYYTEGEDITVELEHKKYTIAAKFRKYTGSPEKCIEKIA